VPDSPGLGNRNSVDGVPAKTTGIPDGGDDKMPQESRHLPFKLPSHLRGLEAHVSEAASRMCGPSGTEEDFERAVRLVIVDVERKLSGYHALGRVASNRRSLPAQIKVAV
jgi:hypothetical protein